MRIGLTGGIGAGKSTVAAELAAAGAVIIDADAVAREVVEPGRPALARLTAEFGTGILTADGSLARAELARVAFAEPAATAALNTIMHPAIAVRTQELMREHAERELVVHDVPLLVENGLSPDYHLALLVDVPAEVRLDRLVNQRGMERADAVRRIGTQASDEQRYRACDVIIDNSGSPEATAEAVRTLVADRLLPFAEHISQGRCAPRPGAAARAGAQGGGESVVGDSTGGDSAGGDSTGGQSRRISAAHAAERIVARLRTALEATGILVEELVESAVPGARDTIDLQLVLGGRAGRADVVPVLAAAGYPAANLPAVADVPAAGDPVAVDADAALHCSADPGCAVDLHVRAARD